MRLISKRRSRKILRELARRTLVRRRTRMPTSTVAKKTSWAPSTRELTQTKYMPKRVARQTKVVSIKARRRRINSRMTQSQRRRSKRRSRKRPRLSQRPKMRVKRKNSPSTCSTVEVSFHNPKPIFCLECGLPPEYCEFGQKDTTECKAWLADRYP
jgi:hypothetical protein